MEWRNQKRAEQLQREALEEEFEAKMGQKIEGWMNWVRKNVRWGLTVAAGVTGGAG